MNSSTDLSRKANPIQQAVKKVFGFPEMGILLTLAILVLLMSVLSERFFTFGNLMSVLRQISMTCIVAVGLAFVLICGAFDLSTSAVLAFGGVFCAWMHSTGVNIWLAALIAISVGAMIGVLNSVIVVKLGVNAFIATMATQNIIKGFAYLMTNGYTIIFDTKLNFLGNGDAFGVPNMVIFMIVIVILGDILLNKTAFGKRVLAVGGNAKAARMSGISVFGIKACCYALCSALCVLSGILNAFNLSVADTAAGPGNELEFMAAVVIGGTPMEGGRGSIRGIIIGAAILGIIITLVLLIAAVIVASLVALRLAVGIGGPIKACSDRLHLLSQGNLEAPVPDFDRNDEVGELVSSTKIIVTALSTILKDIDYLLSQMGEGNFVVDSRVPELYIGDFAPLLVSMRRIKNKLSDVLSQIHTSSAQIAAGSSQVSDGAQALAQGATEQASSVQELAATVHDISQNVDETADVSRQSRSRAEEAGGQVMQSNKMMLQMTTAMAEITEFSKKIGNIITTIEDIAFQTNILALNAAVEAARAGTAGKGFAVVADEVRNLAFKSDQAAKATKELIESSVESVQNGNAIVTNVTDSLQKTTDLAGLAVDDMVRVAEMVDTISAAIAQVTVGLDQISAVVQTNSATSEQSAAASEELSSQAQLLDDLVGQFRLPDNVHSYGDTLGN